jgi:hypothetical protein
MKMKRKTMFCMLSLLLLSAASVTAQVTIGGNTDAATGALLDLNSPGGVKGGLLLSSIAIDDLGKIPANALTGISSEQDENEELRGIMVYNTGTLGVPAGIYVWNGYCWSPDGSCAPIIIPSPSPAFAVFSSRYADLAVTADGCPPLVYTWYKSTEASTTGGTPVGNDPDAVTYRTPTGLEEGIHFYYCTVESPSSNVVATSDLFTVTVSPCSGAIVFNGAYDGPSAGTYTTGLNGSFSANWSNEVFSAQNKDLCWAKTDISETQNQDWTDAGLACEDLATDGASWRLPNLKELQFLYETLGGTGSSATDFANLGAKGTANSATSMQSNFYWSSTEGSSGNAYGFGFANGYRSNGGKTYIYYVRCVRSL